MSSALQAQLEPASYFAKFIGGSGDVTIAKANLESYFEELRREFEEKTGRMWEPLLPVRDVVWSLEDDEGESDGDQEDGCEEGDGVGCL